jgi:hypothetical protein
MKLFACLAFLHGSGGAYGGDGIMNTWRFAIVAAASCGTVVLAGGAVARLPGFATASIENSGADAVGRFIAYAEIGGPRPP